MRCVWEHVYGLHGGYSVEAVEELEVAGLRSGVAGDVYDSAGAGIEDDVHHIRMHAGTRWVGDDDVGTAVPSMASGTYSMPITSRA